MIPKSAKEKKYFIKDMSKSLVLTKGKKVEENPLNKSENNSSLSPTIKKVKYNCYLTTENDLSIESKKEVKKDILSNTRSKSEDKLKNNLRSLSNSKRNLVIETENSLSSKNFSLRSRQEKRVEYDMKLKNQKIKQKEKSREMRSTSNPQINSIKRKEISYDSLTEDRPKRLAKDEGTAKNHTQSVSYSHPSAVVKNNMVSVLSDFNSDNQRTFKEKKSENVQSLIEKISAIKLKDLEVKNEKERNKKLEQFQHKLAVLNDKGKLGFLENEDNKNNTITESEENIEEMISSSPECENKKLNLESSNEVEAPLKTSGNLSKKNHIINTSSFNPLDRIILQSKSFSSTTRKPKVDTFDYYKKIKPNFKRLDNDSAFRTSFSKEKTKRNEPLITSESIRNAPVKLSHKIISGLTSENYDNDEINYRKRLVLEQKKKRNAKIIEKKREDEEKYKKTYLNLKKLDAAIKSKSVSITKNNQIVKNTSNYLFRAQEESSILDNEKYYIDIFEFIKDKSLDIKNNNFQRFNSTKNATSKLTSFRESMNIEKDIKKEIHNKRKFSSNSNSVKHDNEVKVIQITAQSIENPQKNLEIITSPKSSEFNSMYNPLSTPEEEKIRDKDKKQSVNHNNFKQFLEEKIKKTVRSLDSNEVHSYLNTPANNDNYQPQFTYPTNNSIQNPTTNLNTSGKFGNNVFPLIIEGNQKTQIVDEKTKINEFKKKYDHCIERFKTLTENSIVSNISGNLSFKKNLGNNLPESSNIQHFHQQSINKDIRNNYDQPEKLSAMKIQAFIRKHLYFKKIFKDPIKKPNNDRYNILEDIKSSGTISHSHKSNKSHSPFREKFNLISEEEESERKSSQIYFDNEMESRSQQEILSSFIQNTLNKTAHNPKNNLEIKKPFGVLQSHFSSESQLVNFHKNLYERNLNTELSSRREQEYNISSDGREYSISKEIKTSNDDQKLGSKSIENSEKSVNSSSFTSKRKCYSFVKVPSNNTIILCPNSFDSPKLHRIRLLVEKQKNEMSLNSNNSCDNNIDHSLNKENSRQNDNKNDEEDSLGSEAILWQNHKKSDRYRNNLNDFSQDENSDNKVLNYSRLSNIEYKETSDNKLKYVIPEESNENDSQANKIFQSHDSENKNHEVVISNQDNIIHREVLLDNHLEKENEHIILGIISPENGNYITDEKINNNLNLSGNDINIKETNYNRFEKNSHIISPWKPSNETVYDPNNLEKKISTISPKISLVTMNSKNSDVEADKDESNIEWQLTINSDVSNRSNSTEKPNYNIISEVIPFKLDSQKKNPLIEIKEEEENSKNNTCNIEVHKDEEESYKDDFIENIEISNSDIMSDILNDNHIIKDIKIKPNDELNNNKDISTKSRNGNLSNEKNIDIITSGIVNNFDLNEEKNKDVIKNLEINDVKINKTDKDNNYYKTFEKDIVENRENNRYSENDNDEEKENVKPEEFTNQKEVEIEKFDTFINNLKEKDLEKMMESIANLIYEETLCELKQNLVPKKNYNQPNNNNLLVSINFPIEVQNSAALENSSSLVLLKSSSLEKKIIDFNIYTKEIAPKLIIKIGKKIEENFESIISNLSTPYFNKPDEIIQSIIFKDKQRLDNAYHQVKPIGDPSQIEGLLKTNRIFREFSEENNNLREFGKGNLEYDNILNECVLDCAVELLKKESSQGEPLPWSSRTRTLKYKYDKSTPNSKKKLSKHIEKNMLSVVNEKVGVLPENIELDVENLNQEREKRLLSIISKEVSSECEESWKNFEVEETQVKLELSEMVLEQLLNEVVEIMEHVNLSRKNPSLYLHKSIYSCEDIPRLSFQNTQRDNDDVNQ